MQFKWKASCENSSDLENQISLPGISYDFHLCMPYFTKNATLVTKITNAGCIKAGDPKTLKISDVWQPTCAFIKKTQSPRSSVVDVIGFSVNQVKNSGPCTEESKPVYMFFNGKSRQNENSLIFTCTVGTCQFQCISDRQFKYTSRYKYDYVP